MLSEKTVKLAKDPNFAVLSTVLPDGQPQTHLVWVDTDGEHLLVNTEYERQKAKNARRDPRATILIFDRDDFWSWSEVRGRIVEIVEGQEARDHIDKMAKKYLGKDDYPNPIASPRIILKIAPERELVR